MISYAYLHTNGSLIFKKNEIDPSDFVVQIFELDSTKRETFYKMIMYCCYYYEIGKFSDFEILKLMCKKYKFNGLDYPNYLATLNFINIDTILLKGINSFIKNVLEVDYVEYLNWMYESAGNSYALFEMPMKNIDTAYEYLPK